MGDPTTDGFLDDPDAAAPPDRPIEVVGGATVELVLFPGEFKDDMGVTRGRIYARVEGELVRDYEACAGPAPEDAHGDKGGHVAGATEAGDYTLGAPEHHTSPNWPRSTVPWGARLRARDDGAIEFSADGVEWLRATGLDGGAWGLMTDAEIRFEERTRQGDAARAGVPAVPLSDDEKRGIDEGCRRLFYRADGTLLPSYLLNDFGNWAWNLRRGGARSDYFVHTTPTNEAAAAAGEDFRLSQSHGCIHIRPVDRDEMIARGFLQRGVRFTVKPYGVQGP